MSMSDKTSSRMPDSTERAGYYPVLDALRFVLAFWVATGHFEMIPLFGDPNAGSGFWRLFKHGWSTVVWGIPAVIVFFVISGFCIHMPFRKKGQIAIGRYYLRRYTRILIPVAAGLIVYRAFGSHQTLWGEHSILWESPLWSLACEEIYYAMYPLLRWIRNRWGWKALLGSAFVISAVLIALHPQSTKWQDFGPFGTAMTLLPVWLLGCVLAEQAEGLLAPAATSRIWLWRFAAWLGCWICEMLNFKLHISFTHTMVLFGVIAYLWVRAEVANGKRITPNRYLVAAGAWSYSLYLVHPQGGSLVRRLPLPNLGLLVDWFLVMASSLAFAYLFYLLVERPSHNLARRIRVRGAQNVVEQLGKLNQAPQLVQSNRVTEGPVQV
jgi:peptidoglycan/LPS O-acetylase OafA/YrhL